MGKAAGKDQEQGKLTYPGLLGIEKSRTRAARLVGQAHEAVAGLGKKGWALIDLATYIIERDR
jgi:geranylgeranyl diphosphate synthase type II